MELDPFQFTDLISNGSELCATSSITNASLITTVSLITGGNIQSSTSHSCLPRSYQPRLLTTQALNSSGMWDKELLALFMSVNDLQRREGRKEEEAVYLSHFPLSLSLSPCSFPFLLLPHLFSHFLCLKTITLYSPLFTYCEELSRFTDGLQITESLHTLLNDLLSPVVTPVTSHSFCIVLSSYPALEKAKGSEYFPNALQESPKLQLNPSTCNYKAHFTVLH